MLVCGPQMVCMCVCVEWTKVHNPHIVSVHSLLCQCTHTHTHTHTHSHSHTIWGRRADGAKTWYCQLFQYSAFRSKQRSFWNCQIHFANVSKSRPHRVRALTLESQRLSMIERGHQMDGWPLCSQLCTCPELSSIKFCTDSTGVCQMRLWTDVPCV